jgi:hypothetical protein
MDRTQRRYTYVVYPSPADKRKRTNGQKIVVGADWYVRGTMLRYIYQAEDITAWPMFGWHPETTKRVDCNGQECLGIIYQSYLREYGRKAEEN